MKKRKTSKQHSHLKKLYQASTTGSQKKDSVNSPEPNNLASVSSMPKESKKDIAKTILVMLFILVAIILLRLNLHNPAIFGLSQKIVGSFGF